MKETKFIDQNKKKWGQFESSVRSKSSNPEELSEQFNEITDDLSYARTFYQRRSVRVYLNQVAQGVYNSLYKQKKEKSSKLWSFWKTSLPLDLYHSRKNILLAFLMFALWTGVGALSQAFNEDFVRTILGDAYVESTLQRIQDGDPLGIYGESGQTSMFLRITMNNIRVSFIAFILGVFWTVGTHLILMGNGIMLGSFQYWFKAKGLLLTSILGVWIHGAFEISAIVIAAGAGMTLGNSILFPGSYTRLQSFMIGARRGIKILISLVPVFIMAGFLESFVTRNYASLSAWSKGLIILVSFAIIIFYYVIYPYIVAHKHPDKLDLEPDLQAQEERKLPLYRLRSLQEIFNDGFVHYRQKFASISRPLFGFVLPLILFHGVYVIYANSAYFDYQMPWHENLMVLFGFGPEEVNYWIVFRWTVLLSALIITSLFTFQKDPNEKFKWGGYFKFIFTKVWFVIPFAAVGMFILGRFCIAQFNDEFFEGFVVFTIPFVLLIPFILLYPVAIGAEKGMNPFKALGKGLRIGASSWWKTIGVFIMMSGILMFFWFIIANPLAVAMEVPDALDLFGGLIQDVLIPITDNYVIIMSAFYAMIYLVFFVVLIPLVFNAFGFHYYSMIEQKEAKGLHKELEKFGKRKRTVESDVDFE